MSSGQARGQWEEIKLAHPALRRVEPALVTDMVLEDSWTGSAQAARDRRGILNSREDQAATNTQRTAGYPTSRTLEARSLTGTPTRCNCGGLRPRAGTESRTPSPPDSTDLPVHPIASDAWVAGLSSLPQAGDTFREAPLR
jgi:hypothetical protein